MLRNSPKVTHLASGRAQVLSGIPRGQGSNHRVPRGPCQGVWSNLGNKGKPRKDATQRVTQLVVRLPGRV